MRQPTRHTDWREAIDETYSRLRRRGVPTVRALTADHGDLLLRWLLLILRLVSRSPIRLRGMPLLTLPAGRKLQRRLGLFAFTAQGRLAPRFVCLLRMRSFFAVCAGLPPRT